ncbi:alpha/beta fold hydrolase [Nocardioides sp. B-3]|uniref:alpha/beta fold hydrolase n=1 Tax=Nocardioides sp. B-3 TaxID=2895565 RepID=UPI0021526EE1|nr:alpha/beta hydrolase [Nocardioides sp. B-3]UUZ59196.1 alpha/beta hydrolase [Nocardioides sp. B-3]
MTLGLPRITAPIVRHQLPRLLTTRAKRLSRTERRNSPLLERWLVDTFLFGEPRRPRDTGLVVDQMINCPPATMWGFYNDFMTHERTELLPAYDDIPTVVLVGTRDLLTPPRHGRRIADNVRGAELRVEQGAGHMLTLERPRAVSDALHEVVDRALASHDSRRNNA